jgi:preprotein translocase subunit SecE
MVIINYIVGALVSLITALIAGSLILAIIDSLIALVVKFFNK